MSTPAPSPIDRGNQLLAPTPCELSTSTASPPSGQVMLLTIRTPSTTLTVVLGKDDALTWGRQILAEANKMSGLAVAGPGMPPLKGIKWPPDNGARP